VLTVGRNINGKSLAIIDELGRGTSTRDGLAIAIAMAEALVQSGAFVFFVTHFTELGPYYNGHEKHDNKTSTMLIMSAASILTDRPGILNRHLATETSVTADNIPKLTMLYKVESGPVREQSYGILLAGAVGFPAEFLDLAREVSDTLSTQAEAKKQTSSTDKIARKRKLILGLKEALQVAYNSGMDDGALAVYLRNLQAEFTQRMEQDEGPADRAVLGVEEKSISCEALGQVGSENPEILAVRTVGTPMPTDASIFVSS
jgi:DNA mismatch repair protein MSH4